MIAKQARTAAGVRDLEDTFYKIITAAEWGRFQATDRFSASADDLRDGYIHLLTRQQLAGVIAKYFAGKRPLYVAEFSCPNFNESLK